MNAPRILTAAVAALALSASPAGAATTIGDADGTHTASTTFDQFTWLLSPAEDFRIPADGVITSWRAWFSNDGFGSLVVLRPGAEGAYEVVHVATNPLTGGAGVKTFPARLPVRANDVIGADAGDGTQVGLTSVTAATRAAVPGGDPVVNTTMGPADYQTLAGGLVPILEASVEPDADDDGFGDESQDACDTDPLASTPPCATNLSAALAGADGAVPRGGLAAYVATVANQGPETATGARVELTLPAGTEFVVADRACTGPAPVVCPVGDLAPGTHAATTVVVRARAAGDVELSARARHDGRELTSADDVAAAPLRLLHATTTPPTTIIPVTTTPPSAPRARVVRICRVPKLRRHTLAAARHRLARAGCRTGRVRGNRRGRVVRQSVPADTRVLARTKVAITLRRR